MADPWRILGLSADTADEKQVRSAYAKLLKVHRPDQDPEGFQQLRTAYQQALNWLQQRDIEPDVWDDDEVELPLEKEPSAVVETRHVPPPLPPSFAEGEVPLLPHQVDPQPSSQQIPPPLPPSWAEGEVPLLPHQVDPPPPAQLPPSQKRPERDWPREWSYSIVTLDRALENPGRYLDIITMALRALAVDVQECGIPPDAVECIISDAFDADAGLFGMTAPVAILTHLLQGGRTAFLNRAIKALEQADSQAHLKTLAQKLAECEVDAWSARTADVFFHAAGLLAMHQPYLAQSMQRKLRGILDAKAYEAEFDSLETRITRGIALRDLTPDCRVFWSRRLEHPEAPCDWEAEPSVNALNNVMLLGPMWEGYPLVKSVVPAEVLANAWKYQWLQVAIFRLKKLGARVNLLTVSLAAIGGLLLMTGAHIATQVTPEGTRKPAPAKTKAERNSEERLNRLMKEIFEKDMQKNKSQSQKQ